MCGRARSSAYLIDDAGTRIACHGYLDDCLGTIKIWIGRVADIKPGWQLCDGTERHADLREKFVLGAYGDAGGDSDFDSEVVDGVTQPGNGTDVHDIGGLRKKLVNWKHRRFGSPLLRTEATALAVLQTESFRTEKEDPPLGVSGNEAYTDFAETGVEVRDPNNAYLTSHDVHTHPIFQAEASYASGTEDGFDQTIPCTDIPKQGNECGPTDWIPEHEVVEPGTANHSDPSDQDPTTAMVHDTGHRHGLADFDIHLYWGADDPADPYDGHWHHVLAGTLDGKLTVYDVSHLAVSTPLLAGYHYHDLWIDNHLEFITRIPPYYALAYIQRVD